MNKSIKNIVFGVLGQVITILIGLILPRLRIVSFGSEVNGLLTSVQQIYVYLALLEAGVGATSLQALYKPVATDDKDSINSVISATHSYYKRTGIIYLIAVIVLAIVYPLTVSSGIEPFTVVAVIVLNGAANVLAYFFQGKYKILLQAEGKEYVTTNLTTAVTTFSGIAKIVLMFVFPNVIALQVSYFLFSIFQVLYFAIYIKRHYKWIDLKAKPTPLSQKKSALIHQVSQLVFNNTDVLLLTYFCGLKVVSVYALYNMIYDMISVLIGNVNKGFSFKLGQLFNSDREKFDKLFNLYERFYLALSFSLYCVCFLLMPEFISLYTRGVTDIDYAVRGLPLLFLVVKILVSGRATSGFVATYAGHFKLTQNRALIEMGINIVVSVVAVIFWGIYGVLIGTIAALLYRANDMIIYCNSKILKRKNFETYKWWLLDILLLAVFTIAYNMIPITINSYVTFFIVACIITAIICIAYFAITFIVTDKEIKKELFAFLPNKLRIKK